MSVIRTFISVCTVWILIVLSNPKLHAAPPPVYPTVNIVGTNISCYGGSNGSATAVVTPGSTPSTYAYSWNTGATSSSIPGLVAGTYGVVVTELATGYTFFDLIVITEPGPITVSNVITNVNCFSQSTGAIDLTVSGGTPPFTYQWSNSGGPLGFTTQDLTNIPASTYNVIIRDSRLCTYTQSFVVTQPASAIAGSVLGTGVSCAFGSDGTVNLTVWGGTPPYTFNWNGGTWFSEDLLNVPAGTYSVIATDSRGCTFSTSYTVTTPTALTSSIAGSNVSCFGGSNGSINLSPSGGTLPYSFNWTNTLFTLGNSEDLFNISADSFWVVITDANGCTANNSIVITQPTALTTSITGTNISCFGYSDGSVDLTVNGGVGPYSYAWFNSSGALGFPTQDLINVPAETYNVVVTDANLCNAFASITLTQPGSPLQATVMVTPVRCFGNNDGAIDMTVVGGTSPYAYNWSNGATTEDISALIAGTYSVTVVDTMGCMTTASGTITQPLAPLLATNSITPVSCFGFSDGAVDISPSGGTTPYSYSWQNSTYQLSFTGQDLNGFPSDDYYLVITDSNACTYLDTFNIPQPPALQMSFTQVNILCFGDLTGSIDLSPAGGVQPYTYAWSNSAITEDISGLGAGTYTILLSDQNGCQLTDSVTLTQPAAGLASTFWIEETTCFSSDDGAIYFTVTGGTQPWHYLWSTGDTTQNLTNLMQGSYPVLVSDNNGCTLRDTVPVTGPADFTITAVIAPVLCNGDPTGDIDITVTGGTQPYDYLWRDSKYLLASTQEDLIGFPSDTFLVTVTDTNGCEGSMAFFLSEPAALWDTIVKTDVSCFDGNDGSLDLSVSGGITPYTYTWSNGASSQDIDSLIAGMYGVMILDSNGCILQDSLEVNEPDSIAIVATVTPVSCEDQADGVIDLSVTGGSGGYQYSWSNGASGNPATGLSGENYAVTVTDAMGCTNQLVIAVPVNPIRCLNIPNSFTPNGDGTNDNWVLRNIQLYPECSVKVYNQWGTEVYHSTGYLQEWDGTYKGSPLPAHTYYYIIVLDTEIPPYTGPVTIVR